MATAHATVQSLGASVVAIGPGAQYQAAHLATTLPYRLLLDPDMSVPRLLGLREQSAAAFFFNVKGWLRWLAAFLRHRRQGRLRGRKQTLPGVAIVSPQGEVLWLHQGRSVADYPKIATVVARLREQTAPTAR